MTSPSLISRNDFSARFSLAAVAVAVGLRILNPARIIAEDWVDYRFEDYNEDGNRMHIQTHSAYVEKELNSKITARGNFVYDSISGASPTGGAPAYGSDKVPLNRFPISDIRRAESLELAVRYGGIHTTTPQIAYSKEGDYESVGLALNHSIEFNQKNTTVTLGLARNFDQVSGFYQIKPVHKDTFDGILGVTQLLNPKTYITANLSLGYADGYLNDPYKGVNFYYPYPGTSPEDWPTEANIAEKRPTHRFKQVLFLGGTHFITPLKASVDANYRFHHDSYDIFAHTVTLQWNQKLGEKITVSPMIRWYRQTAARFYQPRFVGEVDYPNGTTAAFKEGSFVDYRGGPAYPQDPTGYEFVYIPAHPDSFSADYRLSEFDAYSVGIGLHWRLNERLSMDLAYKRYEMHGIGGITPQDSYPKAHVLTAGMGIWF